MNSIILPAALAIALTDDAVIAVQHNAAVQATRALADSGGGDGGPTAALSDRKLRRR